MRKNWKTNNIIWLLVGTIFVVVVSFFYYQRTFSERFVDEEENFVFGKQIIKRDKIYGDLFSVHQPIPYLISAGTQFVINPNSIYAVVKWHRQFMIVYSIFWGLLLLYIFGKQMLFFLIPYELGKVYLFGHLFLAEGLVVYPLIFVLALLFIKKKAIENTWVLALVGLLVGYCGLSLAPIWPILGLISIYCIYKIRHFPLKIGVFFIALLVPVLSVIPFISISDYFDQIFRINSQYNIPYQVSEPFYLRLINAFLSPILVFIPANGWSMSLKIMQLMAFILLVSSVLVFRSWKMLIMIFVLLGLGNIRFYYPGKEGYEGFHLLPWFCLLCFFSALLFFKAFGKYEKKKFAEHILVGMFVLITLLSITFTVIFKPEDQQKSYYVNYSRQIDTGEILNTLGNKNETYFIGSDDSLSYWQTNLIHANRYISVHSWIVASSELRKELEDLFATKAPTFIYVPEEKFKEVVPLVDYTEIIRYGSGSKIFVLKSKKDTFTNEQIEKAKFWGVQID